MQTGTHFADRPVFWRLAGHLVHVPTLHLTLACEVHLRPHVGVAFFAGLQSAREHLPNFVFRVTLTQVRKGVAADFLKDPGFKFVYVGFDGRVAFEADRNPRGGRIVEGFRVEQDLRRSRSPFQNAAVACERDVFRPFACNLELAEFESARLERRRGLFERAKKKVVRRAFLTHSHLVFILYPQGEIVQILQSLEFPPWEAQDPRLDVVAIHRHPNALRQGPQRAIVLDASFQFASNWLPDVAVF